MKRTYHDFDKGRLHQTYVRASNGEKLVGATSVINRNCAWGQYFLNKWQINRMKLGKDPQKEMEIAGEIGTLTHYLIQCHLEGNEPELGEYGQDFIDNARHNLDGFVKWADRVGFKHKLIEHDVASEVLPYGGRIDLICEIEGEEVLGDIKTSKGIYRKHEMQVVAYAKAYEEKHGVFLPQVFLHVYGGRCTTQWVEEEDVPKLWEAFKALCVLEQCRKSLGA